MGLSRFARDLQRRISTNRWEVLQESGILRLDRDLNRLCRARFPQRVPLKGTEQVAPIGIQLSQLSVYLLSCTDLLLQRQK